MQKNFIFLFVPILLLICCKSDPSSFNDVVKKASQELEVDQKPEEPVLENPKADSLSEIVSDQNEKKEVAADSAIVEDSKPKEVKQTQAKAVKPKKSQIGVMSFDTYVYEFGEIAEGDVIKYDFYFTNTGSGPITVKNASATCGCTVPSYPFIPVEPGDRGFIGVTYNSVGKFGVQTPVVTVVSNAKEKVVKLKLTGKVLEKPSSEIVDSIESPQ